MLQISHIVVLSQTDFVEREVRSFMTADTRPARLGWWLSWLRP